MECFFKRLLSFICAVFFVLPILAQVFCVARVAPRGTTANDRVQISKKAEALSGDGNELIASAKSETGDGIEIIGNTKAETGDGIEINKFPITETDDGTDEGKRISACGEKDQKARVARTEGGAASADISASACRVPAAGQPCSKAQDWQSSEFWKIRESEEIDKCGNPEKSLNSGKNCCGKEQSKIKTAKQSEKIKNSTFFNQKIGKISQKPQEKYNIAGEKQPVLPYFKENSGFEPQNNEILSKLQAKLQKIKLQESGDKLQSGCKTVAADFLCAREYKLVFEGKTYIFNSSDFWRAENLSPLQIRVIADRGFRARAIEVLAESGFSHREIVDYVCPEMKGIIARMSVLADIPAGKSSVRAKKNKCELSFVQGRRGRYLNREDFYDKIFSRLVHGRSFDGVRLVADYYRDGTELESRFVERASFKTNFSTSSSARKNNIARALERFDGIVLEPGEVLSFNKTTGERNAKNGYMEAKIISGGAFVSGVGGGVCQVSTTLYNACLLAGLEILEVHNHSLPVSYVEPSFDAMVNSGSSDLVIRNNSGGEIIITTSSENDNCRVKIFGKKMSQKLRRRFVKVRPIAASQEIYYARPEEFNITDFEGGEKWLTYPKDGFVSDGYLDYYDEQGRLLRSVKIRENKYNATRGIIIRSTPAQSEE